MSAESRAKEPPRGLWTFLHKPAGASLTSQQQGHDQVGGYFDAAEVVGMGASLQVLDHLTQNLWQPTFCKLQLQNV